MTEYNTPLQCEDCNWGGYETDLVMPDTDEPGDGLCPKCGSTELFEVLVEGVNYKTDEQGIIVPYAQPGRLPSFREVATVLLVVAMFAIAWSLQ